MIAQFNMSTLAVAVAASGKMFNAVTKQLKLQRLNKSSDKRKLVISTNWLSAFGFSKGAHNVEELIGKSQGMRVRLANTDDAKYKLTYGREYSDGKKPEPLFDIRSQTMLDDAFGIAKEVHITFRQGVVTIVPVFEKSDKLCAEPIKLILENNKAKGNVDTTIFNVLDYVELHNPKKVVVEYDDEFHNSNEKVLLDLQLRRMGYTVSPQTNRRCMTASMMPDTNTDEDDDNLATHVIKPLGFDHEKHQAIIRNIELQKLKNVFSGCSAGVDIAALESHGFRVNSLLEWRPHEMRDLEKDICPLTRKKVITGLKSDKSETGAVCAALNSKGLENIFNEDIYKFDLKLNKRLLDEVDKQGVFHISVQCDDFSNCKNKKDKVKSVKDLSSTLDMVFPALRLIEDRKFPMVMVENVAAFATSTACLLFERKLESMGYTIHKRVLNALDYNGYTSRNRTMLFATALNVPFCFPETEERTVHLWDDILSKKLNHFRDVSHTGGVDTFRRGRVLDRMVKRKTINVDDLTKSQRTMYDKYHRSNVIKPGASSWGTLLKSQNRQVAESYMLEMDGKFLLPDNDILKLVMGMEPNFNLEPFTKEVGCEIIGQSIEVPMHKRFAHMIERHISDYANSFKCGVEIMIKAIPEKIQDVTEETFRIQPDVRHGTQLSLF